MRARIESACFLAASVVVFHYAAILVLGCAGFAAGIPLHWAHFWVAAALSAAYGFWLARRLFPKRFIRVFAGMGAGLTILYLVSAYAAIRIYDVSYDGQNYQMETTIQLARGWNPFRGGLPDTVQTTWYINYSPKAAALTGAAVYLVTGRIETDKTFNFVLLAASLLAVIATLIRLFPTWGPVRIGVIGLLAALNPICIVEVFTTYVDTQIASMLTIMIAMGLMLFATESGPIYLLYAMAVLILFHIKIPAVVFACLIGGLLVVALFVAGRRAVAYRLCAVSVGIAIFAIAAIGYNPYITNIRDKGHIFHPFFGKHAYVNTPMFHEGNRPANFKNINRLQRFGMSVLSRTSNIYSVGNARIKWPFLIYEDELRDIKGTDLRIGGFGPLYSGALILSLVILALAAWKSRRMALAGGIFMVALLFVALVHPDAWWGRYVPHLWLIPIAALVLSQACPSRPVQWTGWVLAGILLYNVYLMMDVNWKFRVEASRTIRRQMWELADKKKPVEAWFGLYQSNRIRFDEFKIPYRMVATKDALGKQPIELAYSMGVIRFIESPVKQPAKR
ncbi:hypothetical protein LLG95_16875 [bacterium]|nr:hypothetical protein [bacterium]